MIDALEKLGSTGLNADQAFGLINQLVNQQAFTLAALDVFNASAVLLVLLIPLVWMARPAGQRAGAPAGAH